jgi:hypothetical protein
MTGGRVVEVWDQREYRIEGVYTDEMLGTQSQGLVGAYQDEDRARDAVSTWLDEHVDGQHDHLAMLYRIEVIERRAGQPPRRLSHGRGRLLAWWYFFGDRFEPSATRTALERPTRGQVAARLEYLGQRHDTPWGNMLWVTFVFVGTGTLLGALGGMPGLGFGMGLMIGIFMSALMAAVMHLWAQEAERKVQNERVVVKTGPFITVCNVPGETWRQRKVPLNDQSPWVFRHPNETPEVYYLLFGDETVYVDVEQGRRLARLGPMEDATVVFYRSSANAYQTTTALVLEVKDGSGKTVHQDLRYFPQG